MEYAWTNYEEYWLDLNERNYMSYLSFLSWLKNKLCSDRSPVTYKYDLIRQPFIANIKRIELASYHLSNIIYIKFAILKWRTCSSVYFFSHNPTKWTTSLKRHLTIHFSNWKLINILHCGWNCNFIYLSFFFVLYRAIWNMREKLNLLNIIEYLNM